MPVVKILYVTPWGPSLRTGGGRHCYANARALSLFPGAVVDYVGPEIEEGLPGLPPDIFRRKLARPFRVKDKMKAFLGRSATSLASLFDEFVKNINIDGYDLVFAESTMCAFAFRGQGQSDRRICCVHNVETDFKSFNATGWSRLASLGIKSSERKTLASCGTLLVMHDEDRKRLLQVYGHEGCSGDFFLHPVCSLPPKTGPIPFERRDRILIFVGSLDSQFNEQGLRQFVDRCWPALKDSGHTFVVAGRRPSASLADFLSGQSGIRLVSDPPEMEPLLRNARMLLLPDMSGTGMKLRVAEALSLGIPVVGTRLGLRGYESVSSFGREVEKISDMSQAVLDLLGDPSLLESLAEAARGVWQRHYGIDGFTTRLHGIIERATRETVPGSRE